MLPCRTFFSNVCVYIETWGGEWPATTTTYCTVSFVSYKSNINQDYPFVCVVISINRSLFGMPFWNFVDFSDFIYLFFLWCASFLCFFYSTISSIFTTTTPPPHLYLVLYYFSPCRPPISSSHYNTHPHTHTPRLWVGWRRWFLVRRATVLDCCQSKSRLRYHLSSTSSCCCCCCCCLCVRIIGPEENEN